MREMSLAAIEQAIIEGDDSDIGGLVRKALEDGFTAGEVLDRGLISGMAMVGKKFSECEMFLPQVLRSAKVMKSGLNTLSPRLVESGAKRVGRIVIGTVKGDIHDIGKNLVSAFFEGAGFEVVDLGVDVLPTKFVEASRKFKPAILGMSSLLTTTMPGMKQTIDNLIKEGLRDNVKVLVGGAPVTSAFAESIGADGYAPDALMAVLKAKELVGIPTNS
jgi:5-methyltetrahydrofolate--homocysteine methyltransferase